LGRRTRHEDLPKRQVERPLRGATARQLISQSQSGAPPPAISSLLPSSSYLLAGRMGRGQGNPSSSHIDNAYRKLWTVPELGRPLAQIDPIEARRLLARPLCQTHPFTTLEEISTGTQNSVDLSAGNRCSCRKYPTGHTAVPHPRHGSAQPVGVGSAAENARATPRRSLPTTSGHPT
jgi:hypothetical protein